MKKILVVGKLGYHEETIVKPLIAELCTEFEIYRNGDSLDFFVEDNYPKMFDNYISSLVDFKHLKNYSAVLFVDYWNPLVPLYQMGSHFFNPNLKFIGICHGSVEIAGDVAGFVKKGEIYEKYLNDFYDLVIVPRQFLMDLLGNKSNMKLLSFPMDIALTGNPEFLYKNRVIFAHRSDYDKGFDIFKDFVKFCAEKNTGTEFIVIGNASAEKRKEMDDLGIKFLGYKNFEEQKELCKEGGYAWASVRSELMAYAVWHLTSFGLTPLINDHPAYYNFPDFVKYKTFEDAILKIKNKTLLSQSDWIQMAKTEENNSKKIVEKIKEVIYV